MIRITPGSQTTVGVATVVFLKIRLTIAGDGTGVCSQCDGRDVGRDKVRKVSIQRPSLHEIVNQMTCSDRKYKQ